MNKRTKILAVVLAGITWGLSEIFIGDLFYKFHLPYRSASLTALGFAFLIGARLVVNRRGTSLGATAIAALIRGLVPNVYLCHLVGILLEGCAFEVSWTLLVRQEVHSRRRIWLASSIAAIAGFFIFGLASAYYFGFGKWVDRGVFGLVEFALRRGIASSILLAGLVPLIALAEKKIADAYEVYGEDAPPRT